MPAGTLHSISPGRERFSWLRIRIVVPFRPRYAAIPSKIPGIGLPSSIGSFWRAMTRYLKPSGSSRYTTPVSSSGVGWSGPYPSLRRLCPCATLACSAEIGPARARPPPTAIDPCVKRLLVTSTAMLAPLLLVDAGTLTRGHDGVVTLL